MIHLEPRTLFMTDSPTIDAKQFRQVMRKFATGVTILTVRDGKSIHAMTANSFTSVSLDPMLALVCIAKNSTTHEMVSRAEIFAVNILSDAHSAWARRFAHQVTSPVDPFADIAHHSAETGSPILDDAIAYLDCQVVAAHDAGDHTIFVGRVLAAGFGNASDQEPLLWFNGEYTSLSDKS